MKTCKICLKNSHFLFESKVLYKHQVSYFQCESCKFIQTETPFWLDEAYSSAIAGLDIGLLYRNNVFSNTIPGILEQFTLTDDCYIDYGGGYGVFVRMMRDKGYNFYLYDKYCENLFAQFFELDNCSVKRFAALTAFEVFEHLVDPISEIAKMFEFSDSIIFSTEIQPDISFNSDQDWWYFVPEGGQHVALYSLESLNYLADLFECTLFTNNSNLHILSKRQMPNPFEVRTKQDSLLLRTMRFINRKILFPPVAASHRESLLSRDFEMVKSKLII
ncbi:class I SAM-dependent methyltransferase [Hymenobacter terricola]|uniref:class I SAM-dependent methyltransferase n=1 Tax=Hymenobacter terricola TaxID=2819236 RepID=UPI001B3143DF|nr:class I SAM-dependent methyltransferase [Hymenobacter terricola]